jgi:hypothetical protein
MTTISIKSFNGLTPKLSPRLLQADHAQTANNVILSNGKIVPLKAVSAAVATVAAGTKSIYRWGATASDTLYWLAFQKDTSVIQSPVNNDAWSRIYWTTDDGSVVPRYAPSQVAINTSPYPTASYTLGIPKPASAPSVAGTSTAAVALSTWEYMVTYTTTGPVDSEPSPVATVDAPTSRTDFTANPVQVANIPTPATTAMYTGKKLWARIIGGANFQLVTSLAITAIDFTDNVTTLGANYTAATASVAAVPVPSQMMASLASPLVLIPGELTEYYYTYYRPAQIIQSFGGGVDNAVDFTVPEMIGALSAMATINIDASQTTTVTIPAAAYTTRPTVGYPVTDYAVFRRKPGEASPLLIGFVPMPGSAVTVAFTDAARSGVARSSTLSEDGSWSQSLTAPTLSATTSGYFTAASKVTYQYVQTFKQGSIEGEKSHSLTSIPD